MAFDVKHGVMAIQVCNPAINRTVINGNSTKSRAFINCGLHAKPFQFCSFHIPDFTEDSPGYVIRPEDFLLVKICIM